MVIKLYLIFLLFLIFFGWHISWLMYFGMLIFVSCLHVSVAKNTVLYCRSRRKSYLDINIHSLWKIHLYACDHIFKILILDSSVLFVAESSVLLTLTGMCGFRCRRDFLCLQVEFCAGEGGCKEMSEEALVRGTALDDCVLSLPVEWLIG